MASSVTMKPDKLFLASLVYSFPEEWHGLLAALNSENHPVQTATSWLEKMSSSTSIHWPELVDHLVAEFPIVLDNEALFRPKVFLLPLNIQRNLLAFIHYHSNAVTVECLERLVRTLEVHVSPGDTCWTNLLRKLLKAKVRDKKLEEMCESFEARKKEFELELEQGAMNSLVYMDMSNKSEQKFKELCKKIGASCCAKAENCPVYSEHNWALQSGFHENTNNDVVDMPATCMNIKRGNKQMRENEVDKEGEMDQGDQSSGIPTTSTLNEQQEVNVIEIVESPAKRLRTDVSDAELEEFTVPCPLKGVEGLLPEVEGGMTLLHLDASLMTQVKELNDCLQTLSNCQSSAAKDLTQALKLFSSCTSAEIEEICVFLDLRELSESVSVLLSQQFVAMTTLPSYGNTTIFAKYNILPKLEGLTQAASRVLFTTIHSFAKKHPRPFCDGVVSHLLRSTDFAAPQADVISKIISDAFTLEVVKYVLEKILDTRFNSQGSSFKWSEDTVTVLQSIINLKFDIFDKPLFEKFAVTLEQQAPFMGKSLKFAKLLLAIIAKYGLHVKEHHDLFARVLQNNDTFLKKAGISALRKVVKM